MASKHRTRPLLPFTFLLFLRVVLGAQVINKQTADPSVHMGESTRGQNMLQHKKQQGSGAPSPGKRWGRHTQGTRHCREAAMLRCSGGGAGCAEMLMCSWRDRQEGTGTVLRPGGGVGKTTTFYRLSRLSMDPGRVGLEDTFKKLY